MSNCVSVPNFVAIGPAVAEIWRFFYFQDGGCRHLGIFKFEMFNGQTTQQGRAALPCQIWSKSVKPRPRYGDSSIFQDGGRRLQDGGRRHLEFLKFENFNGRTAKECRTALPCQIWSKSVKRWPRYGDFSIFQDGGRRHFRFLKFGTFNGPTAQERRTASPCKISLKLLKTRPRYCDFFYRATLC